MRASVSQGSMTLDNPIHLEQEFSLDGDDGEEFNDDEREGAEQRRWQKEGDTKPTLLVPS